MSKTCTNKKTGKGDKYKIWSKVKKNMGYISDPKRKI